MLHQHENNLETTSFLKENGKIFGQDCITALKLMYQGVKLNGNTCKQLYGFHDRRLREVRNARPDIVRSAWKKDLSGKRLYVEFWIEKPITPTKAAAIAIGESILKQMNEKGLIQGRLL